MIVPEGYALVPIEPTEAMWRSVDLACHEHWPNAKKMAVAMCAAMIAAAPKPITDADLYVEAP